MLRGKQLNHALWAGYIAVLLVTIMILAKTSAYYMTSSTSILSSLMDSLLDAFVSLTALASIHYANRPADDEHRWGHGKMEAVSALFQAAIIASAGAFVVFEATNRFFTPEKIDNHFVGIWAMAISIILSVVLVLIQRYALTKAESLALEADSTHYSSDVVINIGAMIVLLALQNGAPTWIDPLFALFVAGMLGYVSKTIGTKALNMLLDRELPESERTKVISIIESNQMVTGWHDLRMHMHGPNVIISFDIEIDGQTILHTAHDAAKDIENRIIEIYPNAEILIHIDPSGYIEDTRHKIKGVHH